MGEIIRVIRQLGCSVIVCVVVFLSPSIVLAATLEYLNFDDNLSDQSGAGNNPTYVGGTPTYVQGFSGNALSFDGNSHYLTLPNNLIRSNQNFTISVKFKMPVGSTGGVIFGYQNNSTVASSSNYIPLIAINNSGYLRVELWTQVNGVGAGLNRTFSTDLRDGQWHSVVVTADTTAGTLTAYQDGAPHPSGAATGTIAHLDMQYSQLGLGNASGRADLSSLAASYFSGAIDEFTFLSTAESAAEIAKTAQTISFQAIAAQSSTSVALTATASSGLPVSFNSLTTGVCTVSGAVATYVASGTCSVTASQAGDSTYSAAVSVSRSFTMSTPPVDSVAPTLSAAAVSASGTSLVITASEALDATSVPAASSFTVTSGGVTVPVTGVAVSGSQITLTLGQTVGTGQSVSVAYTAPGSNPLKDAAGNLLASFGASSTTNSSTQVLQLPSPLTKTAVVEGVKAQEKISSRASNFATASVSNRLDWIRVNPGVSQRSYQGIKLRFANPMLDAMISGNYKQNSLGMEDVFEVGKQVASGANETALLKNKVNAEILNQLTGIKSGLGLANLNANPTGDAIVGKWSGWTYGEIIVGDNAADPTAITKIKAKNLAFGADRPTDKEGLIGFAVTLGNDEETVASNGSALEANLFSLAGYRSDQMDRGLALDSMLGYTRMKFDTTRLDGSQTLTGKRLGDQLFAEVALRPVQESEAALKLTPFGKTSIVYSRLRSYTEQGGSYALFYGKQEQSMATVALGVDASYETYYAGARLLPSLGLEYGSSKKFGKGGSVRYVSESTVYLLDPDQAKTESIQLRLGMDYLKKNGQSFNVMLRRTLQTDQTRLTALRVMYTVPLN